MSDRHIRRSGSDYTQSFLSLLPQGQAWPKHSPESVLVQVCEGLCDYWGFVDGRAGDLLERESDPRATLELLSDWERNWGLPDPCFFGEQQSLSARHNILMLKMTLLGAQSREFYIQVASWLGYTITITEYAPYVCGISRVGDTTQQEIESGGDGSHMRWQLGPAEIRYYWTVHVSTPRLVWFRVGPIGGQCGVDTHLEIGLALDLECILNRWKPAHTQIIFDYSQLSTNADSTIYEPTNAVDISDSPFGFSQSTEAASASDAASWI